MHPALGESLHSTSLLLPIINRFPLKCTKIRTFLVLFFNKEDVLVKYKQHRAVQHDDQPSPPGSLPALCLLLIGRGQLSLRSHHLCQSLHQRTPFRHCRACSLPQQHLAEFKILIAEAIVGTFVFVQKSQDCYFGISCNSIH